MLTTFRFIYIKVVDMRWGVRDEASDDHSASELCMRELRSCQQLSVGPTFVVRKCHMYDTFLEI